MLLGLLLLLGLLVGGGFGVRIGAIGSFSGGLFSGFGLGAIVAGFFASLPPDPYKDDYNKLVGYIDDGLAGVQAITVGLGCVFIYTLLGETGLMALPLLLCASVAGFLVWNFPPARIFMGDAGSYLPAAY